jgi:hypothetical protein
MQQPVLALSSDVYKKAGGDERDPMASSQVAPGDLAM